jgi:methylglutamate dehydrogenase subunit A
VLEKGYLGSGNVGRNTTIIRSNYLLPGNDPVLRTFDEAVGGAGAGPQLQRHGQPARDLNLIHSDAQRDAYARRGNAMRLHGVDAELLDREQVRALVPFLDFDNARFPIKGGWRSGAAARCGMTRWPGAMRAGRISAAST